MLILALLLLSVSATAQLIPQEATAIGSVVAGDFGLYPNVEINRTHIFITPAGNRYDITLALATATDTIPGTGLSGYAWKHNLTPVLEKVLLDSMPGTCIAVVDIDTASAAGYRAFATNHLLSCGYVITSVGAVSATSVSIFPNPCKNKFTIQITDHSKINRVSVFNRNGIMVYEARPHSKNIAIVDISDASDGLYLIRILTDDGELIIRKVMKE